METLEIIETWIREGKAGLAREELSRLARTAKSRTAKLQIASFSYRCGVPLLGIRLLNAVVRPAIGTTPPATIEELAVYAQCLTRIGGSHEAINLLAPINELEFPRALFFRAMAFVSQWDYEKSLGLLLRYRETKGLNDYERIVTEINIVAAHLFSGDSQRAGALLETLRENTRARGFGLLHGNCLELSAQVAILRREWSEAKTWLLAAERQLALSGTIDSFVVSKWQHLVVYLREKNRKSLNRLRAIAKESGHWETIRDCDSFEAVESGDVPLYLKLFFGTPFPPFRENLTKRFRSRVEIPSRYSWRVSGGGVTKTLDLSMERPEISGRKAPALIARLLHALAADFYRPARLAWLCHSVYPEDVYHPVHTPARAHEILRRGRSWLAKAGFCLDIEEKDGAYRFLASGACEIRVARQRHDTSEAATPIDKIRHYFSMNEFTNQDAATAMGIAPRSVSRLLKSLSDEKKVSVVGKGRAVRYRLVG